jgi:hypothetical protein
MSFLGMVQWQQLFFLMRYASTEMTNPILSLVGGLYQSKKKVIKREDLDAAVRNDGFKRFLFTRSYGRERK